MERVADFNSYSVVFRFSQYMRVQPNPKQNAFIKIIFT